MSTTPPNTKPARDTVFVSHANPEDNSFALWLTLRLASSGYRVWCDLTNLLGGETFWDNAEEAIRARTAQFCYVLSRSSNAKDGSLRELHLAQSVAKTQGFQDFVVPLHIDDLSHGDVTIELQRILTVSFRPSWAKGLAQLLQRLEASGVPKDQSASAAVVAAWWQGHASAEEGLLDRSEEYVSNIFPVVKLPNEVFFHQLHRDAIGKVEVSPSLPIPASQDCGRLISFATADELAPSIGPKLSITRSEPLSCQGWLDAGPPADLGQDLRRILKVAWLLAVTDRGVPLRAMANDVQSMYFRRGTSENDVVGFDWADGRRGNRQVVGFKTVTNMRTSITSTRYWHYGIDAKAVTYPCMGFAVRSHVFFSDDAMTLWADPKRHQAARASQCKNWWNDAWRDRLLGTMNWLAGGGATVDLPVGNGAVVAVRAGPLSFTSPTAYADPGEKAWADDPDTRDHEDEEETESEES